MNLASLLALALDPTRFFALQGRAADPWQRDVLFCPERQVLLNCSRQSGKSTVVAALALHTALFAPGGALVLIVAPALRQSEELFRKVRAAHRALGAVARPAAQTRHHLQFGNGSRIICLPGKEATIRAFGEVRLLILDEAARVPDSVYRGVRPMLAIREGRLIALSTPFGCRGWFHREWFGDGPWRRFHVPWHRCPRIRPEFIEQERCALGDDWVRQEYEGDFRALTGRVYPDWEQALIAAPGAVPPGPRFGGIDFGWRNPFAAVWGVLDRDDVLWILGERYRTQTPLRDHAAALRTLGDVLWYADPAGRTEREELSGAGLRVRAARNEIRRGIAAVTERIRTERLRIDATACPNLVREGLQYRYLGDDDRERAEEPENRHNHAVDALRYLISRLDPGREPESPVAQDDEPSEAESPWRTV